MSSLDALKSLGIKVKTDDEVKKELGQEDKSRLDTVREPALTVKNGDREMAVKLGLVPEAYKDVEFDVQHIKNNVTEQVRGLNTHFKVKRFPEYIEALSGILSKIRVGVRPDCSYLIGSPNGFGKTSFVNTCIKIMHSKGWDAVPYISLSELAELRSENEKRILKGMELVSRQSKEDGEKVYNYRYPGDFMKIPKVITGCYSWSEYMNSDILFCYMTSLDSKIIESNTLKGILDVRSAKGLPTVVFMSTSLNPYKADYNLKEYVWDEILSYKEDRNCFDRVYHVSCYKRMSSVIGDNDLGIG